MADSDPAKFPRKFTRARAGLQKPLGELVMAFAHLEDQVTFAINILLRITPPEGLVLEVLMQNFNARINLFAALAAMHADNADLKRLAPKVVSLLRQANSDRNNLIHDAWTSYSQEDNAIGKIRYVLADDRLAQIAVLHSIKTKDVTAVVSFVRRVTYVLDHWRTRFQRREGDTTWPAPLPDKFYEGSPLHIRAKDQKRKANPRQRKSSRR